MKTLAQPIYKQPISNSRGVARCKTYEEYLANSRYPLRDLGAREGLALIWFNGPNGPVFLLHKNGKVVGYADLDNTARPGMDRRFYVCNLFIRTEYRGRKLATVLHLGALHVFGKLASDTTMAAGAVAAFRSLEKYGYNVRLLNTDTHKDVAYTWNADGVPVVDGTPITELETEFVFYV